MWLICLVLFFIFANPATFRVTRRAISGLASSDGLATQAGVLVHAILFAAATRAVYRKKSKYTLMYPPGW